MSERDRNRNTLSAVAMAYAPATEVPRDRAVMRFALASIVGRFGDNSEFSMAEAVAAVCHDGQLIELREIFIRRLIGKLISEGQIIAIDGVDDRHAVSYQFLSEIKETQQKLEAQFNRVIEKLFDNPSNTETLQKQLLQCLAALMDEYGQSYAHQVAGRADEYVNLKHSQLTQLCQRVTQDSSAAQTMANAIKELYGTEDPDFKRYTFFLTQNFYFLHLLGTTDGLRHLSQDRFLNAGLLLDTNVLYAFLFKESHHHRSILELYELALDLGIEFFVTERTLDELNASINYHRVDLAKEFELVPEHLANEVRGVVFRAYWMRRKNNPTLSVEGFFEELGVLRDNLSDNWNIQVFDRDVEADVSPSELRQIKECLQQHSKRQRHRTKPYNALEHDAHLYLLLNSERQDSENDESTWLLTLDTTLAPAAAELMAASGHRQPYCMTLDGFLQVLSPYVRADRHNSFAENFFDIVSRNLFPAEELIDLADFRMFSNFDLSIKGLPHSDVRTIIRSVRRAIGDDISQADRNAIAHAVQKAFTDPTLQYRTQLESSIRERDDTISDLRLMLRKAEEQQQQQSEANHSVIESILRDREERLRIQELNHRNESVKATEEVSTIKNQLRTMEEKLNSVSLRADESDRLLAEQKQKNAKQRDRLLSVFYGLAALVACLVIWLCVPLFTGEINLKWFRGEINLKWPITIGLFLCIALAFFKHVCNWELKDLITYLLTVIVATVGIIFALMK